VYGVGCTIYDLRFAMYDVKPYMLSPGGYYYLNVIK